MVWPALQTTLLLAVPAVLFTAAALGWDNTALFTLLTVVAAVIPFFHHFERRRPRPRDIMPIVVLAAVAAAGRVLFAPLPNFKPVTALVIVAGICLGRESGFMTGALAALASNMFFGQGPWTPWQMYAWGMIGFFAGALERTGIFRRGWTVYVYGFAAALAYGLLLDSWYAVGFIRPLTWPAALAAYAAGAPFSLIHAAATVAFLLPLYAPLKRMITRMKSKFGLHDF
ncbi:MAG: DUF6580 family putative transport protein [Acutalibacteraceae bacterium]